SGPVTGMVVDEKGEPLIGVTVKVSGTTTGASTDIDGKFSINIPGKKGVLTFSYVGYRTINVDVTPGQKLAAVKLEPTANDIDEVVVIGYGTAKKSSLTSSVEVITGDELTKIPAMNVDQSLAGTMPGLGVMSTSGDPSSGSEAQLAIRGNNNNPLLVIDGVPRLGTNTSDGEMRLSDLNPDDIESISVLKDAAAAAVYGARAANGVILVQTKRGKEGGKARVNFRGQFNFQEATYLPKFLDAYHFAELYNKAVAASESSAYTPYDLSLLGSNPNVYGNENMLDYLDKWGHSQRYTLSVSGGVKSIRYFVSGGYTNTKGLYSNVSRDRFNYSAKIDADLFKGLSASINLNGSVSTNKNSSYTTIDAAYSYSPLQVLRFTDGNLASISGGNPLIDVEGLGGYNKVQSDFHTLDAQLRYQIPCVDGLQVYLKGTLDLNHQNTSKYSKPVALYLYDEVTGETSVDPKTIYPNAKISLQDRWQRINNKLIELGVNYNHTFAEKHDVTGLLVANYQDYNNKYMSGTNPNLPGEYPEIMGSTSSGQLVGSEYYSQRASLVGRATYGYASRYFAEFSFRVDGSTRFAPGHRWGFFPTLSASWVISNEKFFENISSDILSFAKLRGSVGILGDDGAVSDYSYLNQYMFSPSNGYPIGGNFAPGITIASGVVPNENLQWGKSKDWNIGVDLGFWNNRVNITAEYYQRYRTNMITGAPAYLFPPSVGTGGSVPSVNIGKVRYQGVDLSVKHLNTIGDFKYSVNVNLSVSDNKVLDYGDESTVAENLRRAGKPFMVWSLYESAGLFQSYEEIAAWPVDQDGMGNSTLAPGDIKYLDQDGNGILSNNDRIYVKNSSLPDLHYGIGLSASWKGIYMNAQFQGVAGYNQRINEVYSLESNSLPRFQDYHLTNSWTPENPNAEYPRIKFTPSSDNNRLASTFWVRNCSFLRLKALTIGYRFPSKMLKKAHLSTLDIALQGGNLFTVSSLHNMDPESLRGYPLSRTYGVTLNFGF
ncbi:MAG: TonB-dependent receptor, partial [Muribaculaceae bacterium]|nr:TonB-dependent receptor [Muribaculaceae bacterium]